MNRDGFAAVILLFAVLALAVIGGIAYVHYVYLPKIAAQNNNVAQPTSTSASSSLPASATPIATTTATQAAAGSKACAANDMNCLIAAAAKCSPAAVEWTATVNFLDVFTETAQNHLALKGLSSAGKCAFSERVDDVSLAVTSQAEQQAKAQGVTDAQIQQQLQASNAQAKQSIGMTTSCTFTTTYLVQMLTNWQKGNISSSDLTSENCTATDAGGKSLPLPNANGVISITPSGQTAPQPVATSGGNQGSTNYFEGSLTDLSRMDVVVSSGDSLVLDQLGLTIKATSVTATTFSGTATKSGQTQSFSLTAGNQVTAFGYVITLHDIETGTQYTDIAGKQVSLLAGALHITATSATTSGSGITTITLGAPSDITSGNLEFKVSSVYVSQMSMTVVNHTTDQSAAVTLNVNQPMTVLGYTMTVTGIKDVQGTNSLGQATFSNEATLTYQ